MDTIRTILDALGYASTVIVILSVLAALVMWFKGILPVLIRLGNGLARRKIAIFAKTDTARSLEDLLCDSKLFNRNNISRVSGEADIGIAERATLFLVYWPDWHGRLRAILDAKADGTALIVYAPQEYGSIPPDQVTLLNGKRNVVVSNFRGRLLNDIVACMITTSYEKE